MQSHERYSSSFQRKLDHITSTLIPEWKEFLRKNHIPVDSSSGSFPRSTVEFLKDSELDPVKK